jgi:hypothetical protein
LQLTMQPSKHLSCNAFTALEEFFCHSSAAILQPYTVEPRTRRTATEGALRYGALNMHLVLRGAMKRKTDLEAAKERKRAYYAKLYADPEYRARKQEYARKRLAEKRADPAWLADHKKKQRKYYRTRGKFLPSRELSRQRSYYKLAANPEWRQRQSAKQRERYANDPAFRAKYLAKQRRLYRARRKRLKLKGRDKPR